MNNPETKPSDFFPELTTNASIEQEKKRFLETTNTKIKISLEKLFHEHIQPRDILLKYLKDQEENNKKSGDFSEIYTATSALPDYDFDNPKSFRDALGSIYKILVKFVDLKFSNPDEIRAQYAHERQERKHWNRAGIFAYELGEHNELILHVPPMAVSPKLGQLKDSLKIVAQTIKENPNIYSVYGESILLGHSLARRLGFNIEKGPSIKDSPRFHMTREEFLERFEQ